MEQRSTQNRIRNYIRRTTTQHSYKTTSGINTYFFMGRDAWGSRTLHPLVPNRSACTHITICKLLLTPISLVSEHLLQYINTCARRAERGSHPDLFYLSLMGYLPYINIVIHYHKYCFYMIFNTYSNLYKYILQV